MKVKHVFVDSCYFLIVLSELLASVHGEFNHKVVPACSKNAKVCKFEFDIRYKFTMVHYSNGISTPVVIRNGTMVKRSVFNSREFDPLTAEGNDVSITFALLIHWKYSIFQSSQDVFTGLPIFSFNLHLSLYKRIKLSYFCIRFITFVNRYM